jgi:hypothetical protein
MITIEEAKNLAIGDIIFQGKAIKSNTVYASNGQMFISSCPETIVLAKPIRWKVNGKVKIWKRSPERVQVPLKHGLYTYGYLTEDNLELFSLTKD